MMHRYIETNIFTEYYHTLTSLYWPCVAFTMQGTLVETNCQDNFPTKNRYTASRTVLLDYIERKMLITQPWLIGEGVLYVGCLGPLNSWSKSPSATNLRSCK